MPSIPCALDYDDPEGDGFVAFADAPAYEGYIGDWELDTLLDLFAQRGRTGSLAVQYVGQENCWVSFDVRSEPSDAPAVHEVSLPLTITDGALWATSYTDLTMVAQFDHYTLADEDGTRPVLALANGDYVLTFRWLTLKDPRNPDESYDTPNRAELVITPGTCAAPEAIPGAERLL